MREIAIYSAIAFLILVLVVCSVVTVRYRIARSCLIIFWLGIPVRWVRLTNIRQITVQRVFWAEKWFNSLTPGNRYLLIHKNFCIIFPYIAITPRNHMVFKAELERARNQLLTPESESEAPGPSDPCASEVRTSSFSAH